jgi:hypothetical protein
VRQVQAVLSGMLDISKKVPRMTIGETALKKHSRCAWATLLDLGGSEARKITMHRWPFNHGSWMTVVMKNDCQGLPFEGVDPEHTKFMIDRTAAAAAKNVISCKHTPASMSIPIRTGFEGHFISNR